MKLVVCLLVVLPLALSAPLSAEEEDLDKRFFLDSFHLPSVESLGQKLLSVLGSDTSEAACEAACPATLNAFVPGAGLVGSGLGLCSKGCHWVQQHVG